MTTAGAVEPYQEYRKRIEAAQNMTALTNGLFGESVSLYNGKTDFQVTDVDLPGNNALPVRLHRRFSVELHLSGGSSFNANLEGAGGWEVDVPHISGTFSGSGSSWASTRCTGSMVPTVPSGFAVTDIWQGNTIHIPGDGDRTMLGLESTTPRPSDGITRKWTTAQRDAIDCIPMVAGLAGEGFRVTTVGGVKYHFNHAVSRYAGTMRKTLGMNGSAVSGRTKIYVLATRVEDRFGNWVQYQYNGNGHPTKIWSNDGREIVLTYSGSHLVSASAHGRTWTYGYGAVGTQTRLTSVTLPDGSAWTYGYSNGLDPSFVDWDGNSTSDCAEQPPEVSASFTFTATHPGSASGSFEFGNTRHYRSGIHRNQCFRRVNNTSGGGGVPENSIYYELGTPNFFDIVSLSRKTISGPGISALTWTYQYGGGYQPLWGSSGGQAIYPCTTCPSEKLVTVTNPDQTKTQYRYGFLYALNEGKLLGSSTLSSSGAAVSTQSTTYMTAAQVVGQPFAPRYGIIYSGDDPSSAQVLPELGRTIQQDGATFQMSVNSFDSMARPLSVTRAGPTASRTDVTSYYDDAAKWILNQPATVTNANTGLVVSQVSYDANAMPAEEWSFGKRQQTLSYDTVSSVASGQRGSITAVMDGNNNVTTLSSWKRGTPQAIRHPATPEAPSGATESAVVNDSGWIMSATDENGFATNYTYDAMGRLASIVYPTGDTVGWNTTTLSFAPSSAPVYGLPAGHWRHVIQTGNSRKVVMMDALWRPVVTETYDAADLNGTISQVVSRYDQDGRVSFTSYPQRNLDPAVYNTWANPALTPSALGTHTFYDALGRVTSSTQDSELGLLTTLTEYVGGFQTRVTNPRGFQTVTQYQAFDQPTHDFPSSITHHAGADTAVTEIYRDVFSKPTRIRKKDASGSLFLDRHYVYRPDYQTLCKTIEPETGVTVMDYDGAGNLGWSAGGLNGGGFTSTTDCSLTDAWNSGRRINRSYDARNRLKTLTFPDGLGNQAWTYTPDGLPATITTHNSLPSIQDGQQVINAYAYNRRRLMVGESVTQKDWYAWGVGYGYDANASLASQSYYDGSTLSYQPNALGQSTRVQDHSGFIFASGVQYYPNGAVKQFTYGNGIVHTLTQNARQLPLVTADSGGTHRLHYSYDANGNVDNIYDLDTPSKNRYLFYDGLDRLTAAGSATFGGSDHYHRFTYNALDNMTSWKHAGVKDYAEYVYGPQNRLNNIKNSSGATIVALDYDDQGNLDNKSGQNYDFDIGNRLREVSGKEYYRYDGHGRRVMAWRPNLGSVFSQYTSDGKVFFQLDEVQGKRLYNIYLGSSLVAIREVSVDGSNYATKYQHTDALGSPVAVTDVSGSVIERNDYEPYGAVIGKPNYQGIGYTGHVQDGATGLTYMQQRYYDPQVGLFLSVDPVTAYSNPVGMFNRYRYANNNPYVFTDPDGRAGCASSRIKSVCESGGFGIGVHTSVRSPLDTGRNAQSSGDTSQAAKAFTSEEAARAQQAADISLGALVSIAIQIPEMFPDGGSSDLTSMAAIFALKTEAAEIGPLVSAANKPFNSSGLSVAARAWEKHASSARPGGSFPMLRGGVEQKNLAAENFVRAALNGTRTELSRGGFEYRTSTGQGVRFNQDGSFLTFLDPKR